MNNPIHIACGENGKAPVDLFKEFQGELKSLSKIAYEQLKNEILRRGFSFPINVWKNGGTMYILDGHQRLRTLMKMREEGYEIPEIPFNSIEAVDEKEAKLKLLSAASQYGKLESQGLYEFIENSKVDLSEVLEQFRFPEIDAQKFLAEYYQDSPPDSGDIASSGPKEPRPGEQITPGEARTTELPTSHVRMVQLFFNDQTFEEFEKMISVLQSKYNTQNMTDSVLEAVRASYKSLEQNIQ